MTPKSCEDPLICGSDFFPESDESVLRNLNLWNSGVSSFVCLETGMGTGGLPPLGRSFTPNDDEPESVSSVE